MNTFIKKLKKDHCNKGRVSGGKKEEEISFAVRLYGIMQSYKFMQS